jgi:hypothetical protein
MLFLILEVSGSNSAALCLAPLIVFNFFVIND